jgi:hypothetical protein
MTREFASVVRSPLRVNRRRRFGPKRWPDDRLAGELAAASEGAANKYGTMVLGDIR